ncbi:HAD-IC family P-type ATPase [Patescibacteria group bacterium]|nr:HAD-IC family P-type ATPase [Patescibacteria group bacterium]MBU1921749.1 HAD-IC family P-type ATPase [Patescibacteria group bacterium]
MPKIKENWHALESRTVLANLKTSFQGLSPEEAGKRLKKFGPNELPREKAMTAFNIFFQQFKGPLIIILVVADLITLTLGEFIDFGVILAAILLNTVIGFFQEYKANKSLSKLQEMIELSAWVRRQGKDFEIPSRELVPGDIILIEAGSRIPADARIFQVNDFWTNEAALTGESLPIEKKSQALDQGAILAERSNMVYSATTAVRGRAMAVVMATGVQSEVGKIAKMISEISEERTPLQGKIAHFSKFLGIAVLIICFFIFFLGITLGQSVFEMFLTSVAIAVAAIPEGLLVAVTIILAIGTQRILKKKALTRRLVAAETLGSVSVICSDKTGTLTKGEMHVATIQTYRGSFKLPPETQDGRAFAMSDHAIALKIGLLCNDARFQDPLHPAKSAILGGPTEAALFRAAVESGLDATSLFRQYPRKQEVPFDSDKRYMATRNKFDQESDIIYIKGAPEVILSSCSFYLSDSEVKKLKSGEREKLKNILEGLTKKGLRVIATAYRRHDKDAPDLSEGEMHDFIFVAFFGLSDPVRPEAKETVDECRKAGIRPIMVTGDHLFTAISVARDVGMKVEKDNFLQGKQLDKMTDREFQGIVKKIDVYARVEPRHKVRIIDAWQEAGEVVAMTGDGVNDAPALKSADVGVALGSGTDVAQETSDIVLLDNNFKTIINAVHQGRIIFDNIRKVVVYLLSDSFSEMILIFGALVMRLPLPITAAQILWINLITDGLPNAALTIEPGEKDVMNVQPRRRDEPLLNREMKAIIFLIGIITDIGLLALFAYMLNIGKDIDYARTIVFAALGIDSLFYVFSCKSLRHTIFRINPFSNIYLVGAVIAGLGIQLLALYAPFFQNIFHLISLHFKDWLLIIAIGIVEILVIELTKLFFIHPWSKKRSLGRA